MGIQEDLAFLKAQRERREKAERDEEVRQVKAKEKRLSGASNIVSRGLARSGVGRILQGVTGNLPTAEQQAANDEAYAEQGILGKAFESALGLGPDLLPLGAAATPLAAAGAAAAGPFGAVTGGLVVPFAIRDTLLGAVDEYIQLSSLPEYKDMTLGEVVAEVAKSGGLQAVKGIPTSYLLGLAKYVPKIGNLPGVKQVLNSKAGQLVGRVAGAKTAEFAYEAGVLTLLPSAMEGKFATLEDLGVNIATLGLLRGAVTGNKTLWDYFKKADPNDLAQRVKQLTPQQLQAIRNAPNPSDVWKKTLDIAAQKGEERAVKIEEGAEEGAKRAEREGSKKAIEAEQKLDQVKRDASNKAQEDIHRQFVKSQEALDAQERGLPRESIEEQQGREKTRPLLESINQRDAEREQRAMDVESKAAREAEVARLEAENKARRDKEKADESFRKAQEKAAAAFEKERAKIGVDLELERVNEESKRNRDFKDQVDPLLDEMAELKLKIEKSEAELSNRNKPSLFDPTGRRQKDLDYRQKSAQLELDINRAKDRVKTIEHTLKQLEKAFEGAKKIIERKTVEPKMGELPNRLEQLNAAKAAHSAAVGQAAQKHAIDLAQAAEKLDAALKAVDALKAKGAERAKTIRETRKTKDIDLQKKLAAEREKYSPKAIAERVNKAKQEYQKAIDKAAQERLNTQEAARKEQAEKVEKARLEQEQKAFEATVLANLKAANIREKGKAKAEAVRKAVQFQLDNAPKEGFITIPEQWVDPSAPKGQTITVRYVPIPDNQKGMSDAEIIASHLVDYDSPTQAPRAFVQIVADTLKKVHTQLFDEAGALTKISQEGGQELPILQNPKKLFESAGAVAGQIQNALTGYLFDIEGNKVAPALQQTISEAIAGREFDSDFNEIYRAAAAALERQKLGQPNQIPSDPMFNIVNSAPQVYADVHQATQKFMKALFKGYLSKEGITTDAEVDAWFDKYVQHAPMYRVAPEFKYSTSKELTVNASPEARTGKGNKTVAAAGKPIKTAKGGNQQIYNVVQSEVRNIASVIEAANRNRYMRATAEAYEKDGYKAQLESLDTLDKSQLQKLMGPSYDISSFTKEQIEALNGMNNILGENGVGAHEGSGKIIFYRDGKKYSIDVGKEVATTLNGNHKAELNQSLKWFNAFRHARSGLIVKFPKVAFTIHAAEVLSGAFFSKHPLMPYLKSLISSYGEVFGNKEAYLRLKQSPALRHIEGSFSRYSIPQMTRSVYQGLNTHGTKMEARALFSAFGDGMRFLDNLVTKTSHSVSLAEFKLDEKANLAKGMTPAEAAFTAGLNAWERTTPYGREGANLFIKSLNRIFPFFGTAMASTDQFFRQFNPATKEGRMLTMKAFKAMFALSAAAYLYNRTDPEYLKETQDYRDTHWRIPFSATNSNLPDLWLKKPWQVGWMFGTLPEIMIESLIRVGDYDTIGRLAKSFESTFSPVAFSRIEEAINGDVMALLNGRHTPKQPKYQKNLEPELQYGPDTTETAKFIASLSPIKKVTPDLVQNMIDMTGGFGKLSSQIVDEMLIKPDKDARPEWKTLRGYLWQQIGKQVPKKYNGFTEEFFDLLNDEKGKYDSYVKYRRTEGDQVAEEYRKKNKIFSHTRLLTMERRIKKLIQQIDTLAGDVKPDRVAYVARDQEILKLYVALSSEAKEFAEEIKRG